MPETTGVVFNRRAAVAVYSIYYIISSQTAPLPPSVAAPPPSPPLLLAAAAARGLAVRLGERFSELYLAAAFVPLCRPLASSGAVSPQPPRQAV